MARSSAAGSRAATSQRWVVSEGVSTRSAGSCHGEQNMPRRRSSVRISEIPAPIIESELLSGVQKRLVVVAEFPTGDTNTSSIVEKLLKEKNAEFYRIEEVEELLSVIRATAKPISSSHAF